MSFAEPGQILVSRSYYDVMARLSEDYAKLFHYEGAKTDKHVREHEVYAISSAPSNLRRTVPVPAPRPTLRLPSLHIPKFLKLRLRTWPDTLAVKGKLLVAALNIVALPWAEVFVDGTRQGVSPPLRSIPLRPGKHRVELRNGSFPAHVQTVELKPGTELSITHRFRR